MSSTVECAPHAEVVEMMVKNGITQTALHPRGLLLRGGLLGRATIKALKGSLLTAVAFEGPIVFPFRFVVGVIQGPEWMLANLLWRLWPINRSIEILPTAQAAVN